MPRLARSSPVRGATPASGMALPGDRGKANGAIKILKLRSEESEDLELFKFGI